MEKHSVARPDGANPGDVGDEEGGALKKNRGGATAPLQVSCSTKIEKSAPPKCSTLCLQLCSTTQAHRRPGRRRFLNAHHHDSNLGPSEYMVNQPEGEDSDSVREQVMRLCAAIPAEF